MKKFNFKFQSILNLKEMEERHLQEEYILLRQAHAEALDILHNLQDNHLNHLKEMQEVEGEGVLDINNALLYRNYLDYLKREIAISQEEESQRREEMNTGFNRMVEKTKERKTFEKLKEKHKTSFVFEQLKNLQNELDDLSQSRFNHQKKSLKLEAE